MPRLREFVPEGIKSHLRLIAAKLRYRDSFVGSPYISQGVVLGRQCSIARAVELGPGVRIGDFSYINCGSLIHSGEVGRYCSIGPYALIGLASHPTNRRSTSPVLYGCRNILDRPNSWEDFAHPPVIGNDVWVGASAYVHQGVRIGHGAIVGSGAVVTRDVPPFAIVAGAPARLLRMRFDHRTVESLLQSCWWEMDPDQMCDMGLRFDAPLEPELPAAESLMPMCWGKADS